MKVRMVWSRCALLMLVAAGPALAADPPAPKLEHNPFTRPESGAMGSERALSASADALTLRGTLVDGREPLANIDGHVVGVGDSFGAVLVIAIFEERVDVLIAGQRLTLTLNATQSSESSRETR